MLQTKSQCDTGYLLKIRVFLKKTMKVYGMDTVNISICDDDYFVSILEFRI